MSRVGNTENLEGTSTYDLLIFDYPDGYPTGGITLGFGTSPKRISGVEKVVQVFLKTLMTYTSTDVVYNYRGTKFPLVTGTYNLQTVDNSEIKSVISTAVANAETQAKSILNITSAGLASQLESVTLGSIDQLDDGVSIELVVLTKSGDSAPIALPFNSLGIEVNE